jgi:hypothetical protein
MYETSSSDEANSSDLSYQKRSTYQAALDAASSSTETPRVDRDEIKKLMPHSLSSSTAFQKDPPPLPPKKPSTSSEQGMRQETGQYQAMNRGMAGPGINNGSSFKVQPSSLHDQDQAIDIGNKLEQPVNRSNTQQESPKEETYLAMTPSKGLTSQQYHHQQTLMGGGRKHSGSGALLNSRTSLTSSHSSLQSLNRFGSEKNLLGSRTPTEALIATATSSSSLAAAHSRTPSQSLVMEHLQLQEEARRMSTGRGRRKDTP